MCGNLRADDILPDFLAQPLHFQNVVTGGAIIFRIPKTTSGFRAYKNPENDDRQALYPLHAP
jgi:hypothetical protein